MNSAGWSLVLLVALPLAGMAQLEPPEVIEARARGALAEERFSQARDLYLELIERFPENNDYLVWTGRISRWSGEPETALQYLDRVLSGVPDHSEALVEKAYVRMSQGRYDDAAALLNRVGLETRSDPDVKMAMARLRAYQDQTDLAYIYVADVLAAYPDHAEAAEFKRQLENRLAADRNPRTEIVLGYGQDRFSSASPAHVSGLTASYVGDATRLGVHAEAWDKFANRSQRIGPLFSQKLGARLWIRGTALWARDARVFARQDYSAGASYILSRGWVPGIDYRHLRFEDPLVHVLSPSVEYYLERPIWLRFAFHKSWSRFRVSDTPNTSDASVSFQFNQQFGSRFTAHLGYAHGNESFSDLSLDRIGNFDANTYSVGGDFQFSPTLATRLFYSHQARSNGSDQDSFGIHLVIRK